MQRPRIPNLHVLTADDDRSLALRLTPVRIHDRTVRYQLALADGVTGLIGVNGAGKTTLIRVLSAELTPSAGDVEILGKASPISRLVRRKIAVMPQSMVLPREVTVDGFLSYMAWLREVPRKDRRRAIDDSLEFSDLIAHRSSRIGALSGGMRRRLLLAQALLAKPERLILDEPTAGLDPEQRIALREVIGDLSWARAVLVSSHLMEDLAPIAQHMAMLDGGELVFSGTTAELEAIGRDAGESVELPNTFENAFLALRRGRMK